MSHEERVKKLLREAIRLNTRIDLLMAELYPEAEDVTGRTFLCSTEAEEDSE